MTGRMHLIVALWLALGFSLITDVNQACSNPLIKHSWTDAYWTITACSNDSALIAQRHTYYGQLDSCGINQVGRGGSVDDTTTNNSFGIKYNGFDNHWPLQIMNALGRGSWAEFEAESDPTEGVTFVRDVGASQPDTGASDAAYWKCDPQSYSAGIAVSNKGTYYKNYNHHAYYVDHTIRFALKVAENQSSDTVCTLTVWNIQDTTTLHVIASDFNQADQWQYFDVTKRPVERWGFIKFEVYWHGQVEFGIDKITYFNSFGDYFMNTLTKENLKQEFQDFYARINPDNHHSYHFHEPAEISYAILNKFNEAAAEVSPYHLGRWIWSDSLRLRYYLEDVVTDEVEYYRYVFTGEVDSVTTGDQYSVQVAYNSLTEALPPAKLLANSFHVDLISEISAFGSVDCSSNVNFREPTHAEISAQAMLCLAYGAQGIGYFMYAGECPCLGAGKLENVVDDPPHGNHRGIVDWWPDSNRFIPNHMYYSVRDANVAADSLWVYLEDLTWINAGAGDTAYGLSGSVVDSVTSDDFPDAPYIEIGLFSDNGGADYVMLVNRRTLGAESQVAEVWLNQNSGVWRVTDLLSNKRSVVYTNDSCSVPLFANLAPGEARLYKLESGTSGVISLSESYKYLAGEAPGDLYGWAVADAGDVDADGVSDFLIGAPGADVGGATDAGKAYVYSGADASLIYTLAGADSMDQFGYAVAGIGDVDSDGHCDFMVGAPGHMSGRGQFYVYSGSDGSEIRTRLGGSYGDQLGWTVGSAGQFNGDGVPDYLSSAPFRHSNTGTIYIYNGGNGNQLDFRDGIASGDMYGYSLAGVGDIYFHSSDDIIAGAPYYNYTPSSLVENGMFQMTPGAESEWGGASGDHLGWSVTRIGDIDADGYDEFGVGAPDGDPNGDSSAGYVSVYESDDGHHSLVYTIEGENPGDRMGEELAFGGNLDGDCYPDFIVGAPGADTVGRVDAGMVALHSGADGTLLQKIYGPFAGDKMGSSIASVTGFGRVEPQFILAGAPFADPGAMTDAGRVWILGIDFCDCSQHGDLSGDGTIDAVDLNLLIQVLFFNATDTTDVMCPHTGRSDLDCDGLVTILDLNYLIDHLFSGGPSPCKPCECAWYYDDCQ